MELLSVKVCCPNFSDLQDCDGTVIKLVVVLGKLGTLSLELDLLLTFRPVYTLHPSLAS